MAERTGVEQATVGALLHDIGKLWAQAGDRDPAAAHWEGCTRSGPFRGCPSCEPRFRYAHATLGARMAAALLGDGAGEVDLVAYHHAQRPDIEHLLRFVRAGDHLSAGERDERYDEAAGRAAAVGRPFLIPPLAAEGSAAQIAPRALGDDWPPVRRAEAADEAGAHYRTLVERWFEAARSARAQELQGDARVDAVLGLVENVASLAPSAFWEAIPDISLAAHLHFAGAFAGALAACGDPQADPAALLVVGDISGIQAFIHRVPSTRAAKQLRARSFYLSLLSLIAARSIARAAGVTAANVLSVSGGNFQVLVPPDRAETVEQAVRELRRAMREVHGPDLDVVLAWTPLGREEVTGRFSAAVARARQELAVAKLRRLDGVLEPALFEPRSTGGASAACRACGADGAADRGDDLYLCDFCNGLVELGRELPRRRFLTLRSGGTRSERQGWRRLFGLLGWDVELHEDAPRQRPADASLFALDAEALADEPAARLLVVGKYVPIGDDGTPADFEQLAGRAQGRPVLACAKVDIDDLGRFFRSLGAASNGGARDTPSRYASASRMLSLFFEGFVDWVAESPAFRDRLYLVFSGGDDAMVIGPWDAVLRFLLQLRKEFRNWTAGNPALHFSAGVAFGGRSRPVLFAMRAAEGELERAKLAEGKDRVTLFGFPFRWDELEAVLALANRLGDEIGQERVSRGVLQDLLAAEAAIDEANPLGKPVYGPAMWRVPHRVRRSGRERGRERAEELAAEVEREICREGGPARLAVAARLAEWRTWTGAGGRGNSLREAQEQEGRR